MADKCSIAECDKPACGRGWCSAHYTRWRRHGDPLAGRTPVGWPMRFLEEALTYEGDDCLIWPFTRNNAGYGQVQRDGRMHLVTRLVCERTHGPAPERYEAAHSCGNGHGGCINRHHLSWKTTTENANDKRIHGTMLQGEKHPSAKLRDEDVRQIKSLRGRIKQTDIAKLYGVSPALVCLILNGQIWSSLDSGVRQ